MKKQKFGKAFAAATAAGFATAGSGGHSTTTVVTQGSGASVSVSGATAGAVESVTIIGDRVIIDGEEVPAEATSWTSKSGKTFTIRRDGGKTTVESD